ncbi:HPP family-domain-containing protein [Filobasidium floriforme]|uniref:HPP family-domain-containing protein n=1 Tax=Filobasidium floriforme TaxID=5210 RepID=UPI001E8D670B|nr:HPP family-domain-containing protein [Filobasidium floriforme]KAH8090259.1 HPP family-domain-containing protein [Filobasidium floriforme]
MPTTTTRSPSMSGSSTSTARDTSLPPPPHAIPANSEKPHDPSNASASNRPPSQSQPPQKQQTGRQGNDKDADDARDQALSEDGPPEDIRYYLPTLIGRFVGYRPPGLKPPFEPLGIPPFKYLSHIPLKYENYIWSTVGSFVGIILIEMVMIRAFAGVPGNGLIVAAFGAGAVLAYSQFESPLAQPRSIIGGSAISCVISVGLTRLFRLSNNYGATSNLTSGELGSLGWINGALSMSLSLLAMQLTGTTHPPGGAAALVAATQGGAIMMSWRYIYVVMVSACLELGWALVWNNLGRRRYPTYWISPSSTLGARTFRRLRSNAHSQQHAEADEKATATMARRESRRGTRGESRRMTRSEREFLRDEQGNHRHVINTEQRLGMGEGAGLRPDRERRLVEEGIFSKTTQERWGV